MDPDERDLILQFVWTRDAEDTIDTPEKLREWLLGLQLIQQGESVTDDDVRLARRLRAATVSLFAQNNGFPADERTAATVAMLSELAPLRMKVTASGELDLEPGGTGVARALSRIMAIGYKATLLGELPRFKACKGCGWAFFDESKNSSRRWCAMGTCGARRKVAAYRKRKREAAGQLPQGR